MPRVRRLPPALRVSSTMRRGGSASITSMATFSFDPGALTRAFAFAPTPAREPEYSQSIIRWSVNGSWLASTSRNS